jgi:hypothetical protein
MRRTARLVMALLALVCGTAQAVEWVSVFKVRGRLEGFVDVSSIRVTGSNRRAWIRIDFAPHTRRGVAESADKWERSSVNLYEFNCDEESYRLQAITTYYEDGTTFSLTASTARPWEAVVPDTIASAEMQSVCAWKPQ